jgi:hypothetical protein
MGESTTNALASTPAPKKAMIRTMGELGKVCPRPSKRVFFRASRQKCTSTWKIGLAAGSLRGDCRPGSNADSQRSTRSKVITAATASASASLRSVRTHMGRKRQTRGRGNGARRKVWKTQTASFPLFPPRLEIRHKTPDSHFSTASAAAISPNLKPSRAPPHRIC